MVKNLPVMRETGTQSLDWEDPLEKAMATHSSILAWRMPWTEEPGWPIVHGSQRVRYDWVTNTCTFQSLQSCRVGKNQKTHHTHTCTHVNSVFSHKRFSSINPLESGSSLLHDIQEFPKGVMVPLKPGQFLVMYVCSVERHISRNKMC